MARWIGGAVATPVLVGVLTWMIQTSLTPAAAPGAGPTARASGPSPAVSPPVSSRVSPSPRASASRSPAVLVDMVEPERVYGVQGDTWLLADPASLSAAALADLNRRPMWSRSEAAWFRRQGAVDPLRTYAKIVLRGNRDERVRVTGIRAEPRCTRPLDGALFFNPPGGDEPSIRIGFDLDSPDPAARLVAHGGWKGDYFRSKTISLDRGEDVVLEMVARTDAHYCEFTLTVQTLTGGVQETLPVDDRGRPFRVSALLLDDDGGKWGTRTSRYRSLYVGGSGALGAGYQDWRRQDPKAYERASGG
ncbi:hypothetical protein [Microbispora sp. NPDC049125]|uniref:hypothetical protein n=1 Tax=Microbispora sp. NPDC049125 TaxID=3154929 RepID=UPI003465D3F3